MLITDFKNIDDVLDFAMQSEQEAFEFYNSLSENAKSEEMKKVFLQFAKEELGHKAKLNHIKQYGANEYKDKTTAKVSDLKISDYIVDVFPKPDMSYSDALIVAMKKEKAAFKLYMDLSDLFDAEELKQTFLLLAMEESKHKLRFELEYDDNVLREN